MPIHPESMTDSEIIRYYADKLDPRSVAAVAETFGRMPTPTAKEVFESAAEHADDTDPRSVQSAAQILAFIASM